MKFTEEENPPKKRIKRSRTGCHRCKRLKIKCDEMKPLCSYCSKTNAECDYLLKLNWGGRPFKNSIPNDKSKVKKPTKADSVNAGSLVVKEIKFVNHGGDQVDVKTATGNDTEKMKSEWVAETPGMHEIHSVGELRRNDTHLTPVNLPDSPFIYDGNKTFIGTHPMEDSVSDSFPPKAIDSSLSTGPPGVLDGLAVENFDGDDQAQYKARDHVMLPQTNQSYLHLNGNEVSKSMETEAPQIALNEFHDISHGVDHLSQAIEEISNGGFLFNLKNSEMLNRFAFSRVGSKSPFNYDNTTTTSEFYAPKRENIDSFSLENTHVPIISHSNSPNPVESGDITEVISAPLTNGDAFSTYSADIERINQYLPNKDSPNLFTDNMSERLMSSPQWLRVHRKTMYLEDEDEDEDEDDNQSSALIWGLPDQVALNKRSTYIDPEYFMKSIPIMPAPWPELLLNVPFYRDLMHFWVHIAADTFVPAPSEIYKDNPFRVLLPQMAMAHPSILTTLLAFSACIRGLLVKSDNTPENVINLLLARTCNELLKLLKNKEEATSDATLATVLLLSGYEVLISTNYDRHRTHTLGARQIIMARKSDNQLSLTLASDSRSSPSSSPSTSSLLSSTRESDIAFFLMRWFAYVDIIGALSSTRNTDNYLDDIRGDYTNRYYKTVLQDLDMVYEEEDSEKNIDYLLGFDVRFLPQFCEIVHLIKETENTKSKNLMDGDGNLPASIVSRALEIKDNLTNIYEREELRRQKKLGKIMENSDPNNHSASVSSLKLKYNILRYTNKFFCDMGILNLYRRVLNVPRESQLIQLLADGMGTILEHHIEAGSSAEQCSVFCIFCSACETLNPHMRQLFHKRFLHLADMGHVSALKSLPIMTRCWETGESWPEAATNLNIDLTLL